jgi:hypothetical protein
MGEWMDDYLEKLTRSRQENLDGGYNIYLKQ